jgi:hypothetical protein
MKRLLILPIVFCGLLTATRANIHAQTLQNWVTQGEQIDVKKGGFTHAGFFIDAFRRGYHIAVQPSGDLGQPILVSGDNTVIIPVDQRFAGEEALIGALATGVDERYAKLAAVSQQSKNELKNELEATKAALAQNVSMLDSVLKRLKIVECRLEPSGPLCADTASKTALSGSLSTLSD